MSFMAPSRYKENGQETDIQKQNNSVENQIYRSHSMILRPKSEKKVKQASNEREMSFQEEEKNTGNGTSK
jgi:hypothetical protein